MSTQRKRLLLAAAAGVIAMFLPWLSISFGFLGSQSQNGMHGEGLLVFLCFVGAGVLSLLGDTTKNLASANWMLALIAGGVASLVMIIKFFNWMDMLSVVGFGFYIALAAALCLLVFAYLHRTSGDTLQSGFDTLKNRFGGEKPVVRD